MVSKPSSPARLPAPFAMRGNGGAEGAGSQGGETITKKEAVKRALAEGRERVPVHVVRQCERIL